MKKALVELGSDEEEGESESKVTNQIFARPRYSELKNKPVMSVPDILVISR